MKVTIYSTTLANYNRIAPTLLETSFSTAIPLEIIYEAPDRNPQITPKQPWEWKFWQYENWNLPDSWSTDVFKYLLGQMDIPDLVHQFGEPWTEDAVIRLLEQQGINRSVRHDIHSGQHETNILNTLAQLRGTSGMQIYNSDKWITREVIASQRIESIYASPNDLPE